MNGRPARATGSLGSSEDVRVQITVNGDGREVAEGLTVLGLLELLETPTRYVAVERNREIVRRGLHGETVLEAGDTIEIVTMVGGG
jgi:thiamine biosynthesis protein ThiS